jgi:methylated-DNA-[protein]-cysteine S-methyltransferase
MTSSTTTLYNYFPTPLGELCVQGNEQFVTGLFLPGHQGWHGPGAAWREADALFAPVREQLAEYFAGERQQFDLPLKLAGTPFQLQVWQELMRIPYGATISYAALAERIGRPSASRAVGRANGCNPISILVPCHRVIGADGTLTGYAGGIEKKRWLLDWESRTATACTHSRVDDVAASLIGVT